MSKEANTQLALRQEKFIRDLKNALIRIENKTYGICRVTGNLINKKSILSFSLYSFGEKKHITKYFKQPIKC